MSVSFDIAVQDAITVPMELQYALEANGAAREVWDSWTAGKRRGFYYRVDSSKMVGTRERRVEEVLISSTIFAKSASMLDGGLT